MSSKHKNLAQMLRKEYIKSNIVYTLRKVKRIDILIADIIKETIEKDIFKTGRNQKTNLILDLKGIKFIDSYGFRILIRLIRVSDIYNKPLYFANVSKEVNELVDLLKLENIFKNRNITIPKNNMVA